MMENIKVFNHDSYCDEMHPIVDVARWFVENESDFEGLDDYMNMFFISKRHTKRLSLEIEKIRGEKR